MASPSEVASRLRSFAAELEIMSSDAEGLQFAATLSKVRLLASESKPHWLRLADEMYFDQVRFALLRIASDIGLFEQIAKSSDNGSTCASLADALNVDAAMLHRILRVLVATGDVIRVDRERYKNSAYSNALATTWLGSAAKIEFNAIGRVFRQFPDLIKEWEYREPIDGKKTGSHAVFDGKSYFEHLEANPDLLSCWNVSMANFGVAEDMVNLKWYEMWPVKERLLDGYHSSAGPLLVDIGGGNEKRAKAFLDSLPQPYSLVVQDLPEAIKEANKSREAPEHIELMAYNLFEKQPIKGARAYW